MMETGGSDATDATGDAAGTITVTVNGDDRQIDGDHTVKSFLESLDLHPAMVVVERNREILARDRYGEVALEAGDVLELVHFVGGG